MSALHTVKVDGEARYNILIGPGLLGDARIAQRCAESTP